MPVYDYSSGVATHTQTLYFEIEDEDCTMPVDPADYECPESDLFAVLVDA